MPRVLIIDDDPMLQEVLQRMLAKAGFETTVASNGAEGLESLHTQPVDLIIIDIVMTKLCQDKGLAGRFGVQQIFHKPLHWEQFLDEVQKIVNS